MQLPKMFCLLTRLFLLSLERSLSFLSRLVLKVASCFSWAISLGWRRTRRYNSRFIILLISSPLPDCPLILALDHLMVVGKYELLCITFTIINPDTSIINMAIRICHCHKSKAMKGANQTENIWRITALHHEGNVQTSYFTFDNT